MRAACEVHAAVRDPSRKSGAFSKRREDERLLLAGAFFMGSGLVHSFEREVELAMRVDRATHKANVVLEPPGPADYLHPQHDSTDKGSGEMSGT